MEQWLFNPHLICVTIVYWLSIILMQMTWLIHWNSCALFFKWVLLVFHERCQINTPRDWRSLFIHRAYSSNNDGSTQAAASAVTYLESSIAQRAKTSPAQIKTKQTLGPQMENEDIWIPLSLVTVCFCELRSSCVKPGKHSCKTAVKATCHDPAFPLPIRVTTGWRHEHTKVRVIPLE